MRRAAETDDESDDDSPHGADDHIRDEDKAKSEPLVEAIEDEGHADFDHAGNYIADVVLVVLILDRVS